MRVREHPSLPKKCKKNFLKKHVTGKALLTIEDKDLVTHFEMEEFLYIKIIMKGIAKLKSDNGIIGESTH